jgi:hypothetical protein
VQEHHAQPARQLAFNTIDAGKQNLFVTVASNQARRRGVAHAALH